MATYTPAAGRLRYAPRSVQASVLGGAALGLAVLLLVARLSIPIETPALVASWVTTLGLTLAAAGSVALIVAACAHFLAPDSQKIAAQVRRALFSPERGNPLHLKDGELLPRITCTRKGKGLYAVQVTALTATVEELRALASFLSSALIGHFADFSVNGVVSDPAHRFVTFRVEDMSIDRRKHYENVEAMCPEQPTLLTVQDGTTIDLTTSGSILVAGKTRSGKTTGVIALLLQVLLAGRDKFGSLVTIIDPKRAELSRLPHAVTIDDDGEGRAILEAVRTFADTVTRRQAVLNDLSEKKGNVVKWWEAGMRPSFLFLDEFVALRSILPKKAAKDDDGYSLTVFDGLLKRIVTMGASAGCFVIISIAEASVEEGGLPAMLRSAMSTRILFRPTMAEARLLWSAEKLEAMLDGIVYGPGDAWFSSTDGVHDEVSVAHFPCMDFQVYAELGRLLREYYTPATP